MGVKNEGEEIVNAWPEELYMKCYTLKEIQAISVKEITRLVHVLNILNLIMVFF